MRKKEEENIILRLGVSLGGYIDLADMIQRLNPGKDFESQKKYILEHIQRRITMIRDQNFNLKE